jgi:hypothetical protein
VAAALGVILFVLAAFVGLSVLWPENRGQESYIETQPNKEGP